MKKPKIKDGRAEWCVFRNIIVVACLFICLILLVEFEILLGIFGSISNTNITSTSSSHDHNNNNEYDHDLDHSHEHGYIHGDVHSPSHSYNDNNNNNNNNNININIFNRPDQPSQHAPTQNSQMPKKEPKQQQQQQQLYHHEKNLEGCIPPVGFPLKALPVSRLPYVCRHLGNINGLLGACMKNKSITNPEACEPCMPPKHMDTLPEWLSTMTHTVVDNELKSRQQRRKEISQLIESGKLTPSQHGIILMTLNWGYKHLFLNWLCGLHAASISDIEQNTLLVASDPESLNLSQHLGFTATVNSSWVEGKYVNVDKEAPEYFALGAHRFMVAFQIIYTFDLISLGYDVIMQDADVVWLKDLRAYNKFGDREYVDIEMSFDNRFDHAGPGNSGFIKINSNCKTKIFMETLVEYIGLLVIGRSDQIIWNLFLREYQFRLIQMRILSAEEFVGGWQWSELLDKKHHTKLPPRDAIWFIHASWTDEHVMKIPKLKLISAWFFDKQCPYYRKDYLPTQNVQSVQTHEIFSPGDFGWSWSKYVQESRKKQKL